MMNKFQNSNFKIGILFKILNLKFLIFFILYSLFFILYNPPSTHAQAVIESDNYKIQMPNFNSGAGIPSSSNYKLDSTIGQTGAGFASSSGYLVRSGFQYIHSIIPFSLTVSDFLINFGNLLPNTPSTLTSTLTVSAGGAGGYKVSARESDYLRASTESFIPDTSCDSETCSQSSAEVWTSPNTYGFGFNMSGDDIPEDFTDATYFRHFANAVEGQSDQIVMSSAYVGRDRSSTITYKVNVSSLQPSGSYQNVILFTAVPSY